MSANAKVDVVEPSKSSASVDVEVKEDTGTSENEAAVSAVVSSTSSDTSVNVDGSDAGSGCLLHLLSNGAKHDALPSSNNSGAVFLKSSWRQHLCRCSSCLVSCLDGHNFACICTFVLINCLQLSNFRNRTGLSKMIL